MQIVAGVTDRRRGQRVEDLEEAYVPVRPVAT